MKCEICHEADARKAIRREKGDGSEEELYVCESCASKEKTRRQKMRQRTIKTQNGSITVCGDIENPPPILGAIISAVSGIVGSIGGEDAPKDLIAEVLPDVLVKAEDWAHYVSGREAVEAAGGKVVLAPMVEGLSTTKIVERILAAHGAAKTDAKG